MFDDFRNAANEEPIEGDENNASEAPFSFPEEEDGLSGAAEERPRRSKLRVAVPKEVMGMTPFQNFVIALLLLLMVAVGGIFFLLITGKMTIF